MEGWGVLVGGFAVVPDLSILLGFILVGVVDALLSFLSFFTESLFSGGDVSFSGIVGFFYPLL